MTWVIVPAAGAGRRMQADRPKTELLLDGKPLLLVTLEALARCRLLEGLVVVCADQNVPPNLPTRVRDRPVLPATGGRERMHSVLAGLRALPDSVANSEFVAVHDAARPCIGGDLVARVIEAAEAHGDGAIAALPVADTLKRADVAGNTMETVDRSGLWRAQTPQVFRRGALTSALERCVEAAIKVSDEAMAMEREGVYARLVTGSERNIKVTMGPDLALAESLLRGI